MLQETDDIGPAALLCAQSGCASCQEKLLCGHEGLVHAVIRRSWVGASVYDDLLQEGRIALWRAIDGYDVERGVTFSTYAWPIIERAVWRAVKVEERQHQAPPLAWPKAPDPETAGMAVWQNEAISQALKRALTHLPPRARQVIIAAYGLEDGTPCSLAAIGRCYGVSREAVRHWRNDALVLLRLPAVCGRLARLCDQYDRQGVRRRQRLSNTWLRRRRGRQP
jgi:RNA polymerase primary sigma factor